MRIRGLSPVPMIAIGLAGVLAGLMIPPAAVEASNLVNGHSIQDHTVTGVKLVNHTVAQAQVRRLHFRTLTLKSGYVSRYGVAQVTRDVQGVVRFRGTIALGKVNQAAFRLPKGYRPEFRLYEPFVGSNDVIGALEINANGTVYPHFGPSTPTSDYVDLNGITFTTVSATSWTGR